MASIAFLDHERAWFKSCFGFEISEIEREDAFCSLTIAEPNGATIIENAGEDERFAGNPLLSEPFNVEFYAGVPIVTREGHAIGAIAVMDTRPRQLSSEQLDTLFALARQLSTRLELRRTTRVLREANERLKNLSLTDELTGLFNYRGFVTHAQHQLRALRSHRTNGNIWMMFADMDDLKDINDRFGHLEGSRAIKSVGEILVRTLREADIIARLGGDEFTALMLNTTDEVAERIPTRLEANFSEYNATSGKPYELSLSVGLIKADLSPDVTIEDIINQADDEMYQAKEARKRRAAA
jgi:diguanylate cyclase (GGDEF)-like protein